MRVVHEACVGFGVACQLREGELSAYLVDEFAYDIVRERSKDGIVIDMSACTTNLQQRMAYRRIS